MDDEKAEAKKAGKPPADRMARLLLRMTTT